MQVFSLFHSLNLVGGGEDGLVTVLLERVGGGGGLVTACMAVYVCRDGGVTVPECSVFTPDLTSIGRWAGADEVRSRSIGL